LARGKCDVAAAAAPLHTKPHELQALEIAVLEVNLCFASFPGCPLSLGTIFTIALGPSPISVATPIPEPACRERRERVDRRCYDARGVTVRGLVGRTT
jgi:hypothetical protein